MPPLAQLQSTSARVSWGVELGARYRDAIRAAGDAGAEVDAWQLDEIVPSSAAAVAGIPIREFTRGVVRGLTIGRPIFGDVAMRGFVWVAQSAFGIARLAITPELTTFWRTLSRGALAYVGEDYPRSTVTRARLRAPVRPGSAHWLPVGLCGVRLRADTCPA